MTTGLGDKTRTDRVAVVVASTDSCPASRGCLSRFADEVRGRGEVVLVDASAGATVVPDHPSIRVIRRPAGGLAPELWRVGLGATEAPLVAFSTAAMLPAPGWLDAMLARLGETGAAAVGGPIEPADDLPAIDRAVYLLRYVNYLAPLPVSADPEPPGDNALYRRDRLRGLDPAIAGGFWEAEVHRLLRARGECLAMAPGAVVTFQGGCRLSVSLGQRFRHARRYGASRASSSSRAGRWLRASAAPAVPMILLTRAVMTLRRRGRTFSPWVSAATGLACLLAAWAAGEACGALAGPGGQAAKVGRAVALDSV